MKLEDAASGFRNQGQFIAALHVSKNLGIPFTDLKTAMLGDPKATTTTSQLSLGQAIQKLKANADAETEASLAQKQANTDIESTAVKRTRTARR